MWFMLTGTAMCKPKKVMDQLSALAALSIFGNLLVQYPDVETITQIPNPDALTLFIGCIKAFPYERITAKDALKSKYFDPLEKDYFNSPYTPGPTEVVDYDDEPLGDIMGIVFPVANTVPPIENTINFDCPKTMENAYNVMRDFFAEPVTQEYFDQVGKALGLTVWDQEKYKVKDDFISRIKEVVRIRASGGLVVFRFIYE